MSTSLLSEKAYHQRQNPRLLRLSNVNTIHRQLRIMLANSLAVIGLSWGLDQKKSGTELTLTNQMDHGIEWQKK